MNFLVIGLGSMGKRRIRCLKALGFTNIVGFDAREDRCSEARDKYGVQAFKDFSSAMEAAKPAAFIISLPPDLHHEYIKIAIAKNIHYFVEASVVDTDMENLITELRQSDIVAAPSATLLFHPAIQCIAGIIEKGELGKLSNIILHSGQYLPDWHTYEPVSDYYVSNKLTGGGREIVPFELSWVTKLFGFPQRVAGNFRKTINIPGAETIDDTYNCLLDYGDFLATVTVDVVSRHATRRLLINGEKKQLVWDWDANCVKVYDPEAASWEEIGYEMSGAEAGYNANIGENMYIEEIRCFVSAIQGEQPFINSMENDHKVLKLLYAIEESDRTSTLVRYLP
ncbi:MAG TPA: Gfo/Idh/MocA family oxidoreductase [Bacillota bacterium]|nr:Gfo/Idh/MocA family oxidoreductase [Bacillota bacterium]